MDTNYCTNNEENHCTLFSMHATGKYGAKCSCLYNVSLSNRNCNYLLFSSFKNLQHATVLYNMIFYPR